ncbi:MAG: hypothetical protein OHK0039_26450 [Bacteroidia bacterium]
MADHARRVALNLEKEWDKTFQLMSWWKTDIVKQSSVMVVGAGALGNEVLKNLALMNVGHILIVDFDTIEYSNLSRSVLFRESDCETVSYKAEVAAQRIREINPHVKTQTIRGDIMLDVGLGVFRRIDVVIGCLDNRLARLFINRHCHKVNKTWVDGGIENLAGMLSVYTPEVCCYECNLSERDWQHINARLGCPDVARRNTSQGRIPTTPISASIIAAMQVQEAIKIIHGNHKQSMAGQRFYYEGMNNFVMQYKLAEPKDGCMAHFSYDPIVEASTLTAHMTIGEALEWLAAYFEYPEPVIDLDYDVVLKLATQKSEVSYDVLLPKPHLRNTHLQQYEQIPGEGLVFLEETFRIDRHFPHLDRPLTAIGIPPLHILRVRTGETMHFVELSGDERFLVYADA